MPVLLLTVVVLVLALAGGTGFVVYRSNSVAAVPAGGGPTAYGIGPSPLLTSSGSPSAVPSKRVTSAAARTSKPATAAATRAPSKKPVATTAAATTVGDQPPVKAGGLDGTVSAFGPYFILNNATGMCVDLEGTGPGAVGQQVVQFTCQKTTADNQEFAFVPNGADSAGDQLYLVRNTSDNLCLDVDGAGPVPKGTSVLEGTCLVHDNQDFRLQPEFTNGGRQFYRLINVASDMCLDVLGDRDPTPMLKLTLAPCASGGDHEWGLVKRSDW